MKKKRLTARSQKDLKTAIGCIVSCLFCLIFIKQLWIYFIIFLVLSLFYIRFYFKHKALEEKIDETLMQFSDDENDDDNNTFVVKKKKSRKEIEQKRAEDYERFLSSLDDELDVNIDEDGEENE